MSKFFHNNLYMPTLHGNIGIGTANPTSLLHVVGSATLDGAAVFNESGAAVDFRIEGDTLPNLLLVDGSADLVYITDAATGGTPPTAPTGGFSTGTLLAVQNNSAATDNAIIALVAGATSGISGVEFGDADDANVGLIRYDHSADQLTLAAGSATNFHMAATAVIINQNGGAVDFRVEGDTLPNLLFCDGSADIVYVNDSASGGVAPTAPTGGFTTGTTFVVQTNSDAGDNAVIAIIGGATTGSSAIDFGDADDANAGAILYDHATDTLAFTAGANPVLVLGAASIVINEDGDDVDVRIEGDADVNLINCDAGTDRVGVGTASAAAKLEVNQNSATGAVPCLELDQDDTDVAFLNVEGTSAGDLTANITTLTTETITGFFKIQVNGADRWVPFSTTPT